MDTVNFLVVAACLCGVVIAQNEPSVSDVLDKLPPELQGKVQAQDVQEIQNKTQAAFKEKCEKIGGEEAYNAAQKSIEALPECVKTSLGLDNPDILKKQIEIGKRNGTVDEVFQKYCARTPNVMNCINNTMNSVSGCFSSQEQKNLNTVYNITDQLAKFVCFKDGDRIALFIAEGGPECFEARQEEVKACVNQTFGSALQFDGKNITADQIPQIAFGDEECKKMTSLEDCVVNALNKCEGPTSANIVQALFKFVRQTTPCKVQETKSNSAQGLISFKSAVVSIALLVAIF